MSMDPPLIKLAMPTVTVTMLYSQRNGDHYKL